MVLVTASGAASAQPTGSAPQVAAYQPPASQPSTTAAPAYYDIQPGVSTRAQVELRYGEPLRRVTPDALIYEYAPAPGDADSERVVITFDPDTQHVARIDAYLRSFLPGAVFREKFGTRIASRARTDGGREEFFYPQLQALIYAPPTAPPAPVEDGEAPAVTEPPPTDASVVAVSFVSARTLAAVFERRFDEALARKAFEEARNEADKIVAVDPTGGEGYIVQGRFYAALGDSEEALVRFMAAINAAAPNSVYAQYDRYMAHLGMASVYATLAKDSEKARAEYILAIESAPRAERSEARLKYARYLKAEGRGEEALTELRKAADAETLSSGEARRVLAETYWEQGDYTVALPQYEALSRIADASPETAGNSGVYYRYGVALRRAGKPAEAIGAYEKAHKADPKQVATLTELAALYEEEGRDPAKAVTLYREALTLDANDVAVNRGLADALFTAGQMEEARRQAEVTLNLQPDDPVTMFTLARCFAGLKDKKSALLWVQRAVDAGFADRNALTSDPALDLIRDERAFKRLLMQG